jgi:predicted nucleic acid-binding protein
VIVSDAGPLIVLLKTNKLSILQEIFKKIVVPTAVYQEITEKEQERVIFEGINWIEMRDVTKADHLLEKLIDKGEAEAIILAKQLKTSLLVDDAKARKYAVLLNVEIIGTLGLLKMAKKRGIIPSVKDVINDMLVEGYYIEEKLIALILKDVDESSN